MKRNDVSNPGPDTRYPAHERNVILWNEGGWWIEGWYDEKRGRWIEAHTCTTQFNVIAWSDPTTDHVADVGKLVPAYWMICAPQLDGRVLRNVYQSKELAEDVATAIKFPVEIVPLYATPPDTAALLRQAPIGHALAMRVLQSDLYRQLDDTERAECDALIHDHLAALRGALPQPKESQHDH